MWWLINCLTLLKFLKPTPFPPRNVLLTLINFIFLFRSAFLWWYLFWSTFHVWPPAVKPPSSPPPPHSPGSLLYHQILPLPEGHITASVLSALSLCQSSYLITLLLTCRCWSAPSQLTRRCWPVAVNLLLLTHHYWTATVGLRSWPAAIDPPLCTSRCWPADVDPLLLTNHRCWLPTPLAQRLQWGHGVIIWFGFGPVGPDVDGGGGLCHRGGERPPAGEDGGGERLRGGGLVHQELQVRRAPPPHPTYIPGNWDFQIFFTSVNFLWLTCPNQIRKPSWHQTSYRYNIR